MRGKVAVVGATGYTGRFVVSALRGRGWAPIPIGRDAAKLRSAFPEEADVRAASLHDPVSLDAAVAGASAVINCAGPFLDSAAPVIQAALRARIHYLDITAEQAAAQSVFETYGAAARDAHVVIAPAMAFYGALADLLVTALADEMPDLHAADIAVALDSWKPTAGTRETGRRNIFARFEICGGQTAPLADPPPMRNWDFPAPFGAQQVVGLPFSEMVTIPRHLALREIHSFLNVAPLKDIRDPATPAPVADASGHSPQIYVMDVIGSGPRGRMRATARGRDIYAATAPIVVEAADRILRGKARTVGAAPAGALFDARDFLVALTSPTFSFEIGEASPIKAA